MFWLEDYNYRENGWIFDNAFFTEFDAALRYLKRQAEEYPEDASHEAILKDLPGGKAASGPDFTGSRTCLPAPTSGRS